MIEKYCLAEAKNIKVKLNKIYQGVKNSNLNDKNILDRISFLVKDLNELTEEINEKSEFVKLNEAVKSTKVQKTKQLDVLGFAKKNLLNENWSVEPVKKNIFEVKYTQWGTKKQVESEIHSAIKEYLTKLKHDNSGVIFEAFDYSSNAVGVPTNGQTYYEVQFKVKYERY